MNDTTVNNASLGLLPSNADERRELAAHLAAWLTHAAAWPLPLSARRKMRAAARLLEDVASAL